MWQRWFDCLPKLFGNTGFGNLHSLPTGYGNNSGLVPDMQRQ